MHDPPTVATCLVGELTAAHFHNFPLLTGQGRHTLGLRNKYLLICNLQQSSSQESCMFWASSRSQGRHGKAIPEAPGECVEVVVVQPVHRCSAQHGDEGGQHHVGCEEDGLGHAEALAEVLNQDIVRQHLHRVYLHQSGHHGSASAQPSSTCMLASCCRTCFNMFMSYTQGCARTLCYKVSLTFQHDHICMIMCFRGEAALAMSSSCGCAIGAQQEHVHLELCAICNLAR